MFYGLKRKIMSKKELELSKLHQPTVSKSVCDHKHGSRIVFGERRCAKCGALFGRM